MRFRGLMAAVTVWACAGCSVPGPDKPADTFNLDFRLPPEAVAANGKVCGAIIFLVDGVGSDVFGQMLQAGELPAIRKYFVQDGLYAPRAVANTPSVTMANLTSVVTGLLPGRHGVTGINWFDRNSLVWRDYEALAQKNTLDGDYTAANIYEQFPDRTTFSVFFQPHRGATKFVENRLSAVVPYVFGCYEFVDRLTLYRLNIVGTIARKRGRWPAVTVCYLLAPDYHAYDFGASSPQYRQAIRHTDRQIGRVLADVERAGLLDKLVLVLTSDHGMGDIGRHWPIGEFLEGQVGLLVAPGRLWEDTDFQDRLSYYQRYRAVLYGSGDRYWAICLRRPVWRDGKLAGFDPWPVRPSAADLKSYPVDGGRWAVDLPGVLAAEEPIDAVAYRMGPDRVRVLRKAGEAEFHQPGGPGGPITYRCVRGTDPLGWAGKVPADALAGEPLTGRQWFHATAGTDFPDLPEQIVAYFQARRAGDIAIFAAPGWDFGRVHRAGHGGLRATDMHVPLLVRGPGIAPGTLCLARTVDVLPTVLDLLGKPVPPGLDGRSLCPPESPAASRPCPTTQPHGAR